MEQFIDLAERQYQQHQGQDSSDQMKLRKDVYQMPQTERILPNQTQKKMILQQQSSLQQQHSQQQTTSAGMIVEEKLDKFQVASPPTSSAIGSHNNHTQLLNGANSTNIDFNPYDSANKKKIIYQRPIPFKSLKRAESTNENFFVGTADKNQTSGFSQISKMSGTLTHFGLNGKLQKSNPLDLLKNMQKDSMPNKLTSTQGYNMQNTLHNGNEKLQIGATLFSQNQILKLKKNNEFGRRFLNQQAQNIEKQQLSPQRDECSIDKPTKRQNTENGYSHGNNNNSFELEELPFKQKNIHMKTTQLSSSTSVAGFNLLNQSPPLQPQQLAQSQNNNQFQNQPTLNNKKNVTLTNFHQITQVGLSGASPSTIIQQRGISPKQALNQNQPQSTTNTISGGSLSFPFGSISENSSKPLQRHPYSQSTLPQSITSQSTNASSMSSPQQIVKGDQPTPKIAFRFSLRKTNSSNIAAAFSSQQQQLQQLKKSISADQQVQQNNSDQEEKQMQYQNQPFELPEQEEISSCEELAQEECASQNSFNAQANRDEKSRTFYISSNQFSTKCASNNNTITSFNDQQSLNTITSSVTSSKFQQNQLKRKINDAMSKATYYSTNFEKQKLFEQQNEEEEANFRELCQVFSIM